MGLKIWLPLNGNTKQYGLSNITMIGSPSNWVNGKIGQCAHFDGNISNVIYNNTTDFNYTDNFSWAVWIKTNFTGTVPQYAFTNGRADAGGYGYGVRCLSSANCAVRFGNQGYTIPVTGGEWTHLAFTKKGSLITIYKNGSIYSSQTFNGTLPTYSDGNGLGLGCFHYSGNIYPFYGDLNDFRIYDHCLSPREVKEISKGLVLHYPLAMPGQENLVANSNSFSGWSINNIFKISQLSTGEYEASAKRTDSTTNQWSRIIPTVKLNPELYPDGITVSFDFKCDDINALDHKCICSLQIYNSSNTRIGWYEAKRSFTEADYIGSTMLEDGVWKRLSCHFNQSNLKTISSSGYTVNDVSYTMLSFNLVKNGSISFKNIKVEEGEIATPWIPNPADAEYSALGFDDGIEYDVSGYGNNGTKVGDITYDSDTPRYNTSAVLDETYITLAGITDQAISQFSVCGWVNLLTGYTTNYGCHLINFSKTYCRICVSKDGVAVRLLLTDGTTNYSGSSAMSASSLSANVWNHYAVTFDNGSIKIYINGELDSSMTATITSISPSASWTIGNHGTTEFPKAKVSDVRFYTTALSADEIADLYHVGASLANNGTLFAGEYVEG